MKRIIVLSLFFLVALYSYRQADIFNVLQEALNTVSTVKSAGGNKIDLGLKEALKVGIKNTINFLGKYNGYLSNAAVKILLPEQIRKVEPILRNLGFGPQFDEFTLSINRAAEKAAPLAADIFYKAILEMSFSDANKILHGGSTAATDYLKTKTYNNLLESFKPSVKKTMSDYMVTQKYDVIGKKMESIPFIGKIINLDIDQYVSSKALDGLFSVLAKEETNIRTNPSARVTDLLKEVFK